MATQAMKIAAGEGFASPMVTKVALANFVVFLTVVSLANLITGTGALATGFVFGFLLGAGNIYWLLRISRKATRMKMGKALGYAALNYYARFVLIIVAFAVIIIFDILNPWPPLAGFIASTMTTIVTLVFLCREGTKNAS